MRGLGSHRLKDLREPQPLSQVVADGLRMDFPPLRSLDARPNNLPTQLTSFVGRERELAEAGALLETNRLVTFTGPGGTGKTRLSLQVAANAAERYPDGLFFVPLETVREPALVPSRIASAIGLAESTNFDRKMLPVTFKRCAGEIETPGVNPSVTAKFAVSITLINKPPLRTKL